MYSINLREVIMKKRLTFREIFDLVQKHEEMKKEKEKEKMKNKRRDNV